MNPEEFMAMQKWDYEDKVAHAEDRCWSFYKKMGGKVFVSVGGLDSATLTLFLWKYIDPDIPAVSVSSLEHKSIQQMHRQLAEMGPFEYLMPEKSKVEVIKEFGYPVISKGKAMVIEMWQNPTKRNLKTRLQSLNSDGGSHKFKLNKKEQSLFVTHNSPFKVSNKCCYYMKEKPCDRYAKHTGRAVIMGLMASEGGQREKALMKHGCNFYGKTVTRSCPFAIFSRQDILRLALDMKTPVPAIYGEIKHQPDGTLETTKAKRTGCTMCGFGIHMEKRPHRFDRLREESPKEWHFWMYTMGWGKVLNYIGVAWENRPEQQGRLITYI
jgi:hypothetical protein